MVLAFNSRVVFEFTHDAHMQNKSQSDLW